MVIMFCLQPPLLAFLLTPASLWMTSTLPFTSRCHFPLRCPRLCPPSLMDTGQGAPCPLWGPLAPQCTSHSRATWPGWPGVMATPACWGQCAKPAPRPFMMTDLSVRMKSSKSGIKKYRNRSYPMGNLNGQIEHTALYTYSCKEQADYGSSLFRRCD